MKFDQFATKIVAENNFIKASFGGFAGAGKTRTATEFIIGAYKLLGLKKPILIIDNEKGSRFLIPIFKQAGIECYIKQTVELADVLESFKFLQAGEIDFLFIDSLTKVWYNYVRQYRESNKRRFMTLQDWGKILPAWQEEFADKYVALTGSCVFTGRGGYTYDMEDNEETKKKEFVKSGVKMKMAGETPFEPDLNIWMDIAQDIDEHGKPNIWREALVMKDRSGLIDGCTFKNPTFKDFSPVVEYLINVPKGEVAKASDTTSLAPKEDYSSIERREGKEIELEKIKNAFTKASLGSSENDKKLKIAISEKFFNTNSWTELEKKSYEELKTGREKMEEMFASWELLTTFEQKVDFVKNYELKDMNV